MSEEPQKPHLNADVPKNDDGKPTFVAFDDSPSGCLVILGKVALVGLVIALLVFGTCVLSLKR